MKIKPILTVFILLVFQSSYAVKSIFFQNHTDMPIKVVAIFEYLIKESKQSELFVVKSISRHDTVSPGQTSEFYSIQENAPVTVQAKFFNADTNNKQKCLGEIRRKTIMPGKPINLIYKINPGHITQAGNSKQKCRVTRQIEKQLGLQDTNAVHAYPVYTREEVFSDSLVDYLQNSL